MEKPKIGKQAQAVFKFLFQNNCVNQELVNMLADVKFISSHIPLHSFGRSLIPVLILQEQLENPVFSNRYYSSKNILLTLSNDPDGKKYLLCSQWYESNRINLNDFFLMIYGKSFEDIYFTITSNEDNPINIILLTNELKSKLKVDIQSSINQTAHNATFATESEKINDLLEKEFNHLKSTELLLSPNAENINNLAGGEIDSFDTKILNFLKKFYDSKKEENKSTVLLLQGEWGVGKSSFIKRLKKKAGNKLNIYEYDLWKSGTSNQDGLFYFSLQLLMKNSSANLYIFILSALNKFLASISVFLLIALAYLLSLYITILSLSRFNVPDYIKPIVCILFSYTLTALGIKVYTWASRVFNPSKTDRLFLFRHLYMYFIGPLILFLGYFLIAKCIENSQFLKTFFNLSSDSTTITDLNATYIISFGSIIAFAIVGMKQAFDNGIQSSIIQTLTDKNDLIDVFVEKYINNSKTVIVLENIDRCDSKTAINILNQICSRYGHLKTIIIITGQYEKICNFYKESEPGKDADDFLKKIFHGFITLPALDKENFTSFLNSGANAQHSWAFVYTAPYIQVINKNFRAGIRISNQFQILIILFKDKLTQHNFDAICTSLGFYSVLIEVDASLYFKHMIPLLEKAEMVGSVLITHKNELEDAEYSKNKFEQLQQLVFKEINIQS